MKKNFFNKNHTEIRSKKVRNIISINPPRFISWGIIIIILAFMILFVFVLNLSFPYEDEETIFQHFWGHQSHCITDSLSIRSQS